MDPSDLSRTNLEHLLRRTLRMQQDQAQRMARAEIAALDLQDKNDELHEQYSKLQEEYSKLHEQYSKLQEEYSKLQDRNGSEWNEYVQLHNEKRKLQEAWIRQKNRIAKLKKQLKVRKLSRGRQVLVNMQQMRRKQR